MNPSKQVTICVRGVSSRSGTGGYGAILLCDGHRKELSGSAPDSSNNRMDLLAAVVALRALKSPCSVTLFSNNTYLTDAISKGWARTWQSNGWRNSEQQPTPHAELWEELLRLCAGGRVVFEYLPFDPENSEHARCDVLAHEAARGEGTDATEKGQEQDPGLIAIIRKHLTGSFSDVKRREELLRLLLDACSRGGDEAVAADLKGRLHALERAFDGKLQALNALLS